MDEIKQELSRLVDIATSEKEGKFELYKKQKAFLLEMIEHKISSSYVEGLRAGQEKINV